MKLMNTSLIANLTVAATVAAVLVCGIFTFTIGSFKPMRQVAGYVASKKVIAAMEYHGIRSAESNINGILWFWRDGHECRLYTQAFMDTTYGKDYL